VDYGRVSKEKLGDMSWETLEHLAPWLAAADSVNLNVVGEPLIYPLFRPLLDGIDTPKEKLHFNTNGLGLTPKMCKLLAGKPVGSVVVSVDGLESNKPIRGVSYAVLRRKIMRLLKARKAAGMSLPLVGIAYTLMRRNLAELPRVMEDLLSQGIDIIHVQPLLIHYECLLPENIYETEGVDKVMDRCRKIAKSHDARLTLFRSNFGMDERNKDDSGDWIQLGASSERYGCIDPFYEIKILHDGTVWPCSHVNFACLNINDYSLDEVWNHPLYRALRKRLYDKRFEGRCERCPFLFGGTINQTDMLQPGVHHSMEKRFLKNYRRS
jgi:radical SAM protein with 4Fe4S-binding SPASM domain